jgi:putative ABC transport system substrate-binding protein
LRVTFAKLRNTNSRDTKVAPRLSRRAFVSSITALAASSGMVFKPQRAYAQQPGSPRHIGVLLVARSPESAEVQAFRQGLRDAGYVEGRDVVIDWRVANGDYHQIPEMVADLVQRKVDVIVVISTPAAQAAQRATTTIPIVLALVADPVGSGLAASLTHPGGNITGLSLMTAELAAKRLQLLKEAIPRLNRVAVLWNPNNTAHTAVGEQLKAAAPALSIKLDFVPAQTPEEISPAFSAIRGAHAQALYVLDDAFFFTHRTTILELASKARIPVIYSERNFPDAGALLSYGIYVDDLFRRSAGYVDKILKGANPGDLPIEQPTKLELVVNLKTARALGITIPESILVRADEVIK